MNLAVERMNQVMVEGIDVVNMVQISDEKKRTGMSIVAAADYLSSLRHGEFPENWKEKAEGFMAQPEITILKKTKKSEKETNIKPMIYKFGIQDDAVFMQVATGSVENLKPEVVMQAFCQYLGMDLDELAFAHHRLEVYAFDEEQKAYVSLDKVW